MNHHRQDYTNANFCQLYHRKSIFFPPLDFNLKIKPVTIKPKMRTFLDALPFNNEQFNKILSRKKGVRGDIFVLALAGRFLRGWKNHTVPWPGCIPHGCLATLARAAASAPAGIGSWPPANCRGRAATRRCTTLLCARKRITLATI